MTAAPKIRIDPRFSVEEYLAFIDTRPSEERWQLIDGVAMMMPPPTIRHQRIASNLARALNDQLEETRPELYAYQEVGLIVPEVDLFRPEADVAVLDSSVDFESSYADRFYLVAEVLSESNTDKDVELKRRRYIVHPDNLYVLIISQTEVGIDIWARVGGWQHVTLSSPADILDLPEFGFRVPIADLYRGTPLARPAV